MMNFKAYIKRTALFLLFAIGFSSSNFLFALKVPSLNGRVNDYAKIIKDSDKTQIENLLQNLEEKNGAQIAVLTLKSLENEELNDFSLKVAETWKLGQADKDNGVLLLISMEEHSIRIETGYGAEGLLTDAKCGLIIRNIIVPEFQKGNYSQGIKEAVTNMVGILTEDEELINSEALSKTQENDNTAGLAFIILAVFIIFFIILIKASRAAGFNPNVGPYTTFNNGPGHNFSGGHSGFSGGGGHFGGGGASGHW